MKGSVAVPQIMLLTTVLARPQIIAVDVPATIHRNIL